MREMIGAYVLGQLDERDHSAVRAHVEGCPACQAEVAELAPLRLALRDVDPARMGGTSSPPQDLGDQVLGRIREDRRSLRGPTLLRRGGAGLLVAAALAGAFIAGSASGAGSNTPVAPPVVELAVRLAVSGVQADAGLVRHTWGTELQLAASGLRDGDAYTVTFVRRDGSDVSGGTFLGTGEKELRCSLNAALPLDDASKVTVTDTAGSLVLDAVVR